MHDAPLIDGNSDGRDLASFQKLACKQIRRRDIKQTLKGILSGEHVSGQVKILKTISRRHFESNFHVPAVKVDQALAIFGQTWPHLANSLPILTNNSKMLLEAGGRGLKITQTMLPAAFFE